MSTQAIQLADLTHIFRALNEINSGLASVSNDVNSVEHKIEATRGELALLQGAFADFVAADLRAKELQLAETRQVKVRQELETRFGHYASIRRHATGILQAADLSLVRQETLAFASEEMLLRAPGYWLAPALLALVSWLRDDRDLATRAISEASRRDDEKTSLFLALIGRRAGRALVSQAWLERYFAMQDPAHLDRQSVVLLDALASGVFGVEVRQSCSTRLATWVQELGQNPNFLPEQRKAWGVALLSKLPASDHKKEFPHLAKYCPQWGELQKALNGAGVHGAIRDHFEGIFNGEIVPSPSLEVAVDELLTKLVSNFDDEELPLRRQERLLELIIQENGDREAASAKFGMEASALDEGVSFMQLLTNAAMHPETSHASLATQRLAISVSRSWIKEAYVDVVAGLRQSMPTRIPLSIEGSQGGAAWKGETSDGANESELLASMRAWFKQQKAQKLAALQFGPLHWAGVAGAAILTLWGALSGTWLLALIGLGIGVALGVTWSNQNSARQKIEAEHATFAGACEGILKACLSEVVEWHRAYAQRDAVSEEVTALFERLAPSQHIHTAHDSARQIVTGG